MNSSFEYISDAKAHIFEGVTVLRTVLHRPHTSIAQIDDFYAEFAKSFGLFAAERLFPALCEEYSNDPDPRRRFTFGYIYRLDCLVTNQDEKCVEITTTLTLRRKSSKSEQFRQESRQTFRLSDGCLLPPRFEFSSAKRRNIKYEIHS